MLKFKIKLDTNGARPHLLKRAIISGLIDYVAMDLKAPLDRRYSIAAGQKVDLDKIRASILLLRSGNIDYEFRTTAVPGLIDSDTIKEIAQAISGARLYAIQQFVPRLACKPRYQRLKPYTKEEAEELAKVARKFVENVKVRGF